MNKIYCALCDSDITYKEKRDTHEDGCICINCYDQFYCKECMNRSDNLKDHNCEDCYTYDFLDRLRGLFDDFHVELYAEGDGGITFELYQVKTIGFGIGGKAKDLEQMIKELRRNK